VAEGISEDEVIPNPHFDAQKFGEFIPIIAEFVALLCCSREDLKAANASLERADDLVFDVMEKPNVNQTAIFVLLPVIQKELGWVNDSTGVVDSPDAAIEAKQNEAAGIKKPVPVS